jgi:hypothetical protein
VFLPELISILYSRPTGHTLPSGTSCHSTVALNVSHVFS